jgi:hypothetical protein
MTLTLTIPCASWPTCWEWITTVVQDQWPNVVAATPSIVWGLVITLVSIYFTTLVISFLKAVVVRIQSILVFVGCCGLMWYAYQQGHLARLLEQIQPIWDRFIVLTKKE